MTPTQELIDEVRAAAAGSPYVVHERPYGFDLTVDVADARWWTLLRRDALERVFTHEVRLDESARTLSVTDVSQRLEWDAGPEEDGPPGLRVEHRTTRGRPHELSLHRQFDVGDGGRPGAVVEHTFDATEGRDLIDAAADAAGWAEKRRRDQSIGLAVAGIAAAAVLVGALVALVIGFSG
jgi:hypothetical protein